jgi:hypothetical protein
VTKSLPKKTPVTPSIWKSFFANGERIDSRALEKFIDEEDVDASPSPPPRTGFPGRNISEDGFGVDWVWMNIALLCVVHDGEEEETPKRNERGGGLLLGEEPSVDKARALLRCAFLPLPFEEKKSAEEEEEEEEEEEDADSEDNRLKTEEEELHSLGANSLFFFFPRRRSALAARREMNDDIIMCVCVICACFFPTQK